MQLTTTGRAEFSDLGVAAGAGRARTGQPGSGERDVAAGAGRARTGGPGSGERDVAAGAGRTSTVGPGSGERDVAADAGRTSTGGPGSGELHVVVGAGPIGSGVAGILARQGHRVLIVTRSGSGPSGASGSSGPSDSSGQSDQVGVAVERATGDASDAEVMTGLTQGAAAIYNCANPPYHRWPALWPPIASSLLGAAERNSAVLVTVSNLYGYGQARDSLGLRGYDAAHPMTPDTPLAATGRKGAVRAQMWAAALAAHQAGRVRAVEVRASDYVGPGASSVLGERVVPRILRGRGVSVLGSTDRLHTWSFTRDVATMAALAGSDPRAWGRVWHTPSGPPRTQREAVGDFARVAGLKPVPVRALPSVLLRSAGLVSPLMRELRETEYQFSEDFVMDSAATQETFGLDPTPWDCVLACVLRSFGWSSSSQAE